MGKEVTTVRIDSEYKALAKAKGINISAILDKTIRKMVKPDVSDIDQSQILFRCSQCGAVEDHIYLCPISNELFCEKCEKSISCPYALSEGPEMQGEIFHEHNRIPHLTTGEYDPIKLKKARQEQYRTGLRDDIKGVENK